MNKDLIIAYTAGFFDGEGSINIITRNRPPWSIEHQLWVSVGQKDGATLDWLKDNFGGNVYLVKRDGSYFWSASNKNAYNFLKRIIIYLQYKKPQAEVALRFYEECPPVKRPIPKEELARREGLRQQLKSMKKSVIKSQYIGSESKRIDPQGM
jgi:hypothetical protein